MTDVRELLARLNPTTLRMEPGTGGGVDALTNIDIAAALGMVSGGLGRDLMELLHGPDPGRVEIIKVSEGVVRLALGERNRRSKDYADARATWGIAKCMANFNRDRQEGSRRSLEMLKARVVVARAILMPENLEDRLPEVVAMLLAHMKGELRSNRERASELCIGESTYRERWASVVDWLLTQMIEAEQRAVRELKRALSSASGLG